MSTSPRSARRPVAITAATLRVLLAASLIALAVTFLLAAAGASIFPERP